MVFALFPLHVFRLTIRSLLIHCAKWIGEGRHLSLLDSVLEHGFEPYESVAPAANDWPKPCDENWISLELTPDPFFLEYFATIVEAKPGTRNLHFENELNLTRISLVRLFRHHRFPGPIAE